MINTIDKCDTKKRYIIPDFLRGAALLGICSANFPEFALYTFQSPDIVAAMPTAGIDKVVKYFQYVFIDGKFYTLFSLLFGVGFSIILSNSARNNRNGLRIFYRRMIVLLLIGFLHLLCLWAGDILILYAFLGLFLPLFRNASDKKLLIYSVVLLLFPVLVDVCITFFGWNLSAPVIRATQYFHDKAGITKNNFPVWLAEADSYVDVLKFNLAGAFIRMQEFIDGNRAFKVMGLFIIGFYIGKNRMYANPEDYKKSLRKIRSVGFVVGLPLSILYAWNAMNGYPSGLAGSAILYAISVFPLSFAYISAICLFYIKKKERRIFHIVAAPGRMALTNYMMQSVFGIIIFYGIGFGLGAKIGLVYVELIALGVYLVQIIYSYVWLHYLRFGPMEWGWRMLTYGEWLSITLITNYKNEKIDQKHIF
ncbi:MAG: DUF418 domain-containing protein [Tannerella sp.]|jgi:uncharacterized protein|nr:DUF418 domain-containing protein [Tannerella sp.]